MAIIDSLVVSLKVTTDAFTAGLNKAVTDLSAFAGKFKTLGAVGAGALAALGAGAVAAVAGITALTLHQTEFISSIAKQSDKLGTSVEFMTAMDLAAKKAGTSIEAVSEGMTHMARTVSEASAGSAEAGQALRQIGVSLDSIKGKGTEEQFKTIADAISKLGSAGDRINATMAIFGRGGVEIAGLLAKGSAGIDDAIAKAKQLGITFSRDGAAGVQVLGDKFQELKASFWGIFTGLAIQAAPALEALVELGQTAIDTLRELFGDFGSTDFFADLRTAFQKVEFALLHWQNYAFLIVANAQLGFISFVENVKASFTSLPEKFLAIFEIISTIIGNFLENMKRVGETIWHFLTTGEFKPFEQVDFTAGIEQGMQRLARASARALTDQEKQLQEAIDKMNADLDAGFDEFKRERDEAFEKAKQDRIGPSGVGAAIQKVQVEILNPKALSAFSVEGFSAALKARQAQNQKQEQQLLNTAIESRALLQRISDAITDNDFRLMQAELI